MSATIVGVMLSFFGLFFLFLSASSISPIEGLNQTEMLLLQEIQKTIRQAIGLVIMFVGIATLAIGVSITAYGKRKTKETQKIQ